MHVNFCFFKLFSFLEAGYCFYLLGTFKKVQNNVKNFAEYFLSEYINKPPVFKWANPGRFLFVFVFTEKTCRNQPD